MHTGVKVREGGKTWSPPKSAHTTDPPKDPTDPHTHTYCPAAGIYRPSLISHSKHNMLPPDQSIQL